MNEYDTACDVGDKKPEAKRGRRKRTTGRVRDGVERPGVLCVRTTFRTLAWFQALARRHGEICFSSVERWGVAGDQVSKKMR
jgi:hypothetical protein